MDAIDGSCCIDVLQLGESGVGGVSLLQPEVGVLTGDSCIGDDTLLSWLYVDVADISEPE